MRNRIFKAMCKVPMNLQLFAEGGDGAGAGEGNGGGSGEGTGGEGDNPPSFDDFLKTGSNGSMKGTVSWNSIRRF